VQGVKKGVGNSKDKRKNEICKDTKPKPKPMDVSGSSKSLRGVGLIQGFQNLDLTVEMKRKRTRNKPDRFNAFI
jgi:hypothetical protein